MKLSFHGADRSVTGSCHLVESAGLRVLIDCVLYQGGRELAEENAGPFGFDRTALDYVLLTRAHLDHCGRLPLLAKRAKAHVTRPDQGDGRRSRAVPRSDLCQQAKKDIDVRWNSDVSIGRRSHLIERTPQPAYQHRPGFFIGRCGQSIIDIEDQP